MSELTDVQALAQVIQSDCEGQQPVMDRVSKGVFRYLGRDQGISYAKWYL